MEDIADKLDRALSEYHRLLPLNPEARIALLVSALNAEGLCIVAAPPEKPRTIEVQATEDTLRIPVHYKTRE